MNCPSCKNPIKDTATFCEWCGASVAQSQTNQTNCEYKLSITAKKQFLMLGLVQKKYTVKIDNGGEIKIKGGESEIVPITQGTHNIRIETNGHPAKEVIIKIEKDAFISCEMDMTNSMSNKGIIVTVGFAEHFIK